MKVKNRELFLKYAIPCAATLVKRGKITQDLMDDLIKKISNKEKIPENSENIFKVALGMCTFIAKKLGKEQIDDEVIRQYFLFEHDKVVDDRYNLMGDFDPIKCRTYVGKVIKFDNKSVIVKTKIGKNNYRTDFVNNLKQNDFVIVHHDFIVEKISKEFIEELSRKKIFLLENQ